jgi:putative pyruvate formate lyase activating enzyme
MLPLYLEKLSLPELKAKSEELNSLMNECRICPNECNINRNKNELGICNSTNEVMISSVGPHYGEEPPLVGTNGSGTIFFTNCNLSCVFCQNFDISQEGNGKVISLEELAQAMLYLQNLGCQNINLVSPTHYSPQIVSALIIAIEKGLEIPLVYNCGGYEAVETLYILENIIDIYMPDIKYSNNENALKYSGIADYWDRVKAAIKIMHKQVGDLIIGNRNIAKRGLIIRHLVLPANIAGSIKILDFIAEEISLKSYVNIMKQYRPVYQAHKFEMLNDTVGDLDFMEILDYANMLNLDNSAQY